MCVRQAPAAGEAGRPQGCLLQHRKLNPTPSGLPTKPSSLLKTPTKPHAHTSNRKSGRETRGHQPENDGCPLTPTPVGDSACLRAHQRQ